MHYALANQRVGVQDITVVIMDLISLRSRMAEVVGEIKRNVGWMVWNPVREAQIVCAFVQQPGLCALITQLILLLLFKLSRLNEPISSVALLGPSRSQSAQIMLGANLRLNVSGLSYVQDLCELWFTPFYCIFSLAPHLNRYSGSIEINLEPFVQTKLCYDGEVCSCVEHCCCVHPQPNLVSQKFAFVQCAECLKSCDGLMVLTRSTSQALVVAKWCVNVSSISKQTASQSIVLCKGTKAENITHFYVSSSAQLRLYSAKLQTWLVRLLVQSWIDWILQLLLVVSSFEQGWAVHYLTDSNWEFIWLVLQNSFPCGYKQDMVLGKRLGLVQSVENGGF